MKNNYISLFLFVFFMSMGCAGLQSGSSRKGLVLFSTYLYHTPNAEESEKVSLNRGEAVMIITQESDESNKVWARVLLSDDETRGWIRKKYLHIGPKRPIHLTQKTRLYVRPDEQSKVEKTLQRGTSMYILREKNGWKNVSITYTISGWIKTDKYKEGFLKRLYQ